MCKLKVFISLLLDSLVGCCGCGGVLAVVIGRAIAQLSYMYIEYVAVQFVTQRP